MKNSEEILKTMKEMSTEGFCFQTHRKLWYAFEMGSRYQEALHEEYLESEKEDEE